MAKVLEHQKLGKLAPIFDPRTLRLKSYVEAMPDPPVAKDYLKNRPEPWPVFMNDQIGDCTCASAGHSILNWSDDAGWADVQIPDEGIVKAYSAVSGYDPKTGNNDDGAAALNVLKYWKETGIAGHTINAYTSIRFRDLREVKQAIYLFGSIYVGVGLPLTAQGQKVWTVPPIWKFNSGKVGSWGGHAICIGAYDEKGLTAISWGRRQPMTWGFFLKYCEEAYAILSPDWFSATGHDVNNFDIIKLQKDLSALG